MDLNRAPSRPITGTATSTAALEEHDDNVRARLVWLLVFRAVVVSVLLITALGLRATADELLFARASVVLYAIAGLAYASILGGAIWVRAFRNRYVVVVAYVQLISDALVGTLLVGLTGGVESVFVFLYSLSVLNAAIVLARRGAMVIAAVSALLYGSVLAFQGFLGAHVLELAPSFLTNGGSFFLVAVLGGYLTGQLSRTSERLQDAHAEIERLEQLYAAVLGSLPSGVMSVGDDGRIVYLNGAGGEILGGRDLVGKTLKERAPFLDDLVHDPRERFELNVAVPHRGPRTIGGSIAPLIGVEKTGTVVVFQDLTELRRLQDEVGRAERLAELGRLAAGLAHEVRNPLAAMIGCLQLLQGESDKLGGDGKRMLGIVHREAERLSMLVQEFLTYARPAPPKREAVRLLSFLEETCSTARQGLKAVDVDVDVEGSGAAAFSVRFDPAQLRQVVWNVLVNADAVIASQGRRGRVRFSYGVERGLAVLHVDDDGPGVPAELRERIFEPFFTTRPDGNGLGLATVSQLVRQNGGTIVVAASPLGGARFTLHLTLDHQASNA